MKLEVYEEAKKEEQAFYLDLVTYEQLAEESHVYWFRYRDGIALVVRSKSGKILSTVLGFKPDGTFVRCEGVDKAIGLKLDELGRIMENV